MVRRTPRVIASTCATDQCVSSDRSARSCQYAAWCSQNAACSLYQTKTSCEGGSLGGVSGALCNCPSSRSTRSQSFACWAWTACPSRSLQRSARRDTRFFGMDSLLSLLRTKFGGLFLFVPYLAAIPFDG